jgi:hypothetical protein
MVSVCFETSFRRNKKTDEKEMRFHSISSSGLTTGTTKWAGSWKDMKEQNYWLVKKKRKTFVDAEYFIENNGSAKPNHFDNRTRNIELPGGQIKKINICSLHKFNNHKLFIKIMSRHFKKHPCRKINSCSNWTRKVYCSCSFKNKNRSY